MKRFAARRGMPCKFVSDNGKTFKAAAKILTTLHQAEDVQSYFSSTKIKWTFNIERAPWWGGLFERMVKSVKRCLRKMIGQAKFNFDELHTSIVEVEAILNSRPLSYITPTDMEEPLTPSHLLTGRRIFSLPDYLSLSQELGGEDFELSPMQLTKRMKYLNNVINHFWKRWRNEYLLELRDSHRQNRGESHPSNPIRVGDVISVHDESLPQGLWRIAKVQDVITGRDRKIRGAVVKIFAKDRQPTLLHRPLQLLYPMEVHSNDDKNDGKQDTRIEETLDNSHNDTKILKESTTLERPQRVAATRANERRQACEFALKDN